MATPAEILIRRLSTSKRWPLEAEKRVWNELVLWAALRDSERSYLARRSNMEVDRYMVDPLPEKISEAFADLVWPEDPVFNAQNEGDQEELDWLRRTSSAPG
jgi:hypothetical protein